MSGMTLWDVTIVKKRGDEDWSNRYIVSTSNIQSAISVGHLIVQAERAVHRQDVEFVSLTVEPHILQSGGGTVVALQGTGTGGVGADSLPLTNTVRVTFRPATGKPSQKYLRLPMIEGDNDNGMVAPSLRTFITTNYVNPLMALPEFVDPQGQSFQSAGVWPRVQNRQLGWKRRSRPNQKRGWVPK